MEPNFIAFYDTLSERSHLLINEHYLNNLSDFDCIADIEVLGEDLDTVWGYNAEDVNNCIDFNKATKERYNLTNYRTACVYGNKLECLGKLINTLDTTPVESKDESRFTEV